MLIDVSITKLRFDTATGRFRAFVMACDEDGSHRGKGPAIVTADADGVTQQEAVSVAISRALASPVFHEGAA